MMRDAKSILENSLRWAFRLAIVVFIITFAGPLLVGGPGAHQGPFGAFFYTPTAFILVFVIAYLFQLLQTQKLSTGEKFVYSVLLILVLAPTINYISSYSLSDHKGAARNVGGSIPPLTRSEHFLLESTHFNMRVGVVNLAHPYPAVKNRNIINDLQRTGLFEEVAEFAQIDRADMIATRTGGSSGDLRGESFWLHQPENPDKKIRIEVYYTRGGITSRKDYLERLSIKIIDAVKALSYINQSRIIDSTTVISDTEHFSQ